MTDRILGPPGIGIAPGAPVAYSDEETPWIVLGLRGDGRWCAAPVSEPPWGMAVEADDLCLDLSVPAGMDAGARALLRLCYPAEPEPVTAPGWYSKIDGWDLTVGGYTVARFRTVPPAFNPRDPWVVVPGLPASCDDDSARRAMALCLAAVAGRAPPGEG